MSAIFSTTKLGRVFAPGPESPAWMHQFAQSPAALVSEDRLRVYFASRPQVDAQGQFVSYAAFVDLQRGEPFTVLRTSPEPVLPLGERGTFDEFGTNPVSVIGRDGEVWMYYAGWTRCESVPFNAAIGVAVSRDGGNSFQRMGPGPVLSYTIDEPFVIGSPRIRRFGDRYYLWYVAGREWLMGDGRPEPVYRIRMAVSDDGLSWRREGRDLINTVLEETECQASPDVFAHHGRYYMVFCYRYCRGFQDHGRGYRIGCAASDDLVHWTREDQAIELGTSSDGWDSEMVSYPHVFRLDDALYVLYQGNGVGRTGFGIARLDDCRPQ